MPFGNKDSKPSFEELQTFFWQHIKSILGNKYNCERADDIYVSGRFTDKVKEKLITADLVLADLTSRNASVCYELGIRHSTGRATIIIAQSQEHIPTNLKESDIIFFDDYTNPRYDFHGKLRQTGEEIYAKLKRNDVQTPKVHKSGDASAIVYALGIREIRDRSTDDLQSMMLSSTESIFRFMGISSQYMVATNGFYNKQQIRQKVTYRFLLLNPTQSNPGLLSHAEHEKRDPNVLSSFIKGSVSIFEEMKQNGFKMECRFYDEVPRYRMIISDESLACIGFYNRGMQGVDTPHIVLEKKSGGLFDPHVQIWEDMWEKAKPAL